MAGSLFLFFIWSVWIYTTFIMEKQNIYRLPMACIALLMIILQSIHISIFTLKISASSVMLLLICYYLTSKYSWKKQLHLLFSVFAIMIGYAGFLLLEMYDPVMIFIDRRILLSFLLILISFIIYPSSIVMRFIFVYLGSLQGDIVYAAILARLNFPYLIGSMEYMDIIAIVSITFIGIASIIKLSKVPNISKSRKINQ